LRSSPTAGQTGVVQGVFHLPFSRWLILGCACVCALLSGCSHDELFGTGPGADAAVSTPSGVQTGLVAVTYTLTSGSVTASDVAVSYSTDGVTFRSATEGVGSDGTRNLSASASGEPHTFVWDSNEDIGGERASTVIVHVRPDSGIADTTRTFTVNNGRFMAAVEDDPQGRVRFYELNAVDGGLLFRNTVNTGGSDPYDVLYHEGFFLVAHRTTNDVAVLDLDEDNLTLVPVDGSPVRTDGIQATYLATYSDQVFVSNPGDSSITIFDFDDDSGALSLNPNSGVTATNCQGILARSGRLYVASQASAQILIFDITDEGELLNNANSPVITGGLTSPRTLISVGTRVYAGNFAEATLAGFNLQGNGNLSALTASPFSISSAGVEQLAALDDKLAAVTGVGASFIFLTVDAFGDLTEDALSPIALTGPGFGVSARGSTFVAMTSTSQNLHVFNESGAGLLTEAAASPVSAGVKLLRVAISD
jgi:hypothetical protein